MINDKGMSEGFPEIDADELEIEIERERVRRKVPRAGTA